MVVLYIFLAIENNIGSRTYHHVPNKKIFLPLPRRAYNIYGAISYLYTQSNQEIVYMNIKHILTYEKLYFADGNVS